MSRPIRINIAGGYYHVINRGRNKQKIYREEKDYQEFLSLLAQCCEQYQAYVLAYCLMANHYHVLICTPNANLPQIMRQLNGKYTQKYNRKYHTDGALFRGRYKSIVIQEEQYLRRVIRYIHLNPRKAGLEKKLGEYSYYSHNGCMKPKKGEKWLKAEEALEREWMPGRKGKASYCEYLEQAEDIEIEAYYGAKKRAYILGEAEFADDITRTYLEGKRYYDREVPEEWKRQQQRRMGEIEGCVIQDYGIERGELFRGIRGKENEARNVAIRLMREQAGIGCEEIAKRYGIGNPRSVSEYCRRVRNQCLRDSRLGRRYERLRSSLQVET